MLLKKNFKLEWALKFQFVNNKFKCKFVPGSGVGDKTLDPWVASGLNKRVMLTSSSSVVSPISVVSIGVAGLPKVRKSVLRWVC